MGGAERIARARDAGRGTVRERIEALLTAEAFSSEERIDPRETRPLLVEWSRRAAELLPSRLGPRARGLRP